MYKSDDRKNIVITGAASGIGNALVEYYKDKDYNIACIDFNKDGLESYINKNPNCKLEPYAIDVSNSKEVTMAITAFIEKYGDIDYLINAAGISKIVPFLDTTEELWDSTININLKGQFLVCKEAIKSMLKKNKGVIINLSSQSGKKGTNAYAPYCASKAGVIALTQSIAKEFAANNIRCNAICPGVIYTPMWDKQVSSYAAKKGIKSEDVMPNFIKDIPLHRLGTTNDVVNLVDFLLSDKSDYMTGQSLNLTGGSWMW